jgi:hypothetical protein
MKVSITTSVVNGLFKRNRNLILDAIKSFNNSEVVVTFEKPKKKRSNNQNQFYWGVCIPLIQSGLKDATGEFRTAENIHYKILLPLFAPTNEIVNTETGECISEKLSSSEMTTTQFCEYILEIQKWATEFLSIDIPSPNENLEIFFN